jgi:hypothetical protein
VAILVTVTLLGSIGATPVLLQQHASAIVIVNSKQIADFQQLTAQLQTAVIKAIGDPNIKEGPIPHLIGDFAKLTAQLRRDVINAAQVGDPNIRGIVINWHDAALRIFLGGPDTIPPLIEGYTQEVLRIFGPS